MLIIEQCEFLKDVCKLITKAVEMGYIVTAGEMWRTEVQAWINSRPAGSMLSARDKDGNLHTYNLPIGGTGVMMSKHKDRLAVDLNFFKKDGTQVTSKADMQTVGNFWQSLNQKNRWGGNFTTRLDCPHFERNL